MLHHCGNELMFSKIGTGYCIDCRVGVLLGKDGVRWWERAKCRGVDPDLFFPRRGDDTTQAVAVCKACPVQVECLEYALDNGERFGIWGGTTGKDRRKMRRPRKLCEACGVHFRPTKSGTRYCSETCRRLGHTRQVAESRRRRAGAA
jgi:WhiB family redox-sensing transcriptional regulator